LGAGEAAVRRGARERDVHCGRTGLTRQALTNRARSDGWRLRGAPRRKPGGTRETLARFKALLQQRLSEFEAQIGTLSAEANAATSERDIRAMNTLVRTLEKVLELERKERARRTAKRKLERRFDDAEREALAEKLMGLQREILAERARSLQARLSCGNSGC
jgi:hypothetical protein